MAEGRRSLVSMRLGDAVADTADTAAAAVVVAVKACRVFVCWDLVAGRSGSGWAFYHSIFLEGRASDSGMHRSVLHYWRW